ncbi:MAG: tetratricopeptide repeat protein [Tannerella sp.]|jgi:tetratricopeptide (TPR) repeat protein|nr:tetratricopeptide repeat protein [Tannerella sp.]
MRKVFLFSLICICIPCFAQKNPKWIEKAAKAVILVETYDKQGNVRKGNGFFITSAGEAVSDYSLFAGAEKAVVTDMDGNQMEVTHILGADELYDVIRFKVAASKNISYLTQTKTLPQVGSEAYFLPYGTAKNATLNKGAIQEVSKIKDQYGYYRIDIPLTSSQVSIPLLTASGEVFAASQADVAGKNNTYGISVSYIQQIHINGMDLFNKTYSSIGIRKAWPEKPEDAQVALLLYASNQDAAAYLETLNDFIKTFPNYADGYMSRASHYVYQLKRLAATEAEQMQMLNLAKADMETAGKHSRHVSDAYYNEAKLIYNIAASDSTVRLEEWSIEKAKELLNRAIANEDMPVYHQLAGDIAFYENDFAKAFESYMHVNQSPAASAESYYSAAKAQQQLPNTNLLDVIALLDSAVRKSPSPVEAIAYLQEAIDFKTQYGQYEAVVKDYDLYYILSGGNVTDAFYYYREQAKFRTGNFEGALKDISAAIAVDPANVIYQAEEGAVYLRMQDYSKARQSIEKAIELDPEFASGHRLLGICLLRQEKKNDACQSFAKAKDLGDPVVEKLIKENCR